MKSLKCPFLSLALLTVLITRGHAQSPPDNSLAFSGMGQYFAITNFGAIVPTNEITVEVWIYANVIASQTAFAMNFGTPADRFAASTVTAPLRTSGIFAMLLLPQ